MALRVLAGRPTAGPGTNLALRDALDALDVTRLRAGFAYVTLGGVEHLLIGVATHPKWAALTKRFIVSVGHGISEPAALLRLRQLPNAEVRIFTSGRSLSRATLEAGALFHPKVICLDGEAPDDHRCIIASSANLTFSAQANAPRNFEIGLASLSTTATQSAAIANSFDPWWGAAWGASLRVTPAVVRRYAELRLRLVREKPDLLQLQEPPLAVRAANHMWIEVGAASGIQRHQVEFNQALASFFGAPRRRRVDIELRRGGIGWAGRPLSHKRTTYGVDIWRLGTPTIAKGGIPIQNRVIWFERTSSPRRFNFDVAEVGSTIAESWKSTANQFGHLGKTAGSHSRMFGYY